MFSEILHRRVYGCQGLLAGKLWLCNLISPKLTSGLRAVHRHPLIYAIRRGSLVLPVSSTGSLLPSSLSRGAGASPGGHDMSHDMSRPAPSRPWIPAPGGCEGLSGLLCASGRTPGNILGSQSCGWGSLPGWQQARSGGSPLSGAPRRKDGDQGPPWEDKASVTMRLFLVGQLPGCHSCCHSGNSSPSSHAVLRFGSPKEGVYRPCCRYPEEEASDLFSCLKSGGRKFRI